MLFVMGMLGVVDHPCANSQITMHNEGTDQERTAKKSQQAVSLHGSPHPLDLPIACDIVAANVCIPNIPMFR